LSHRLIANKIKVTQPPKGAVMDLEELSIEEKLEQLKISDQKNMTKTEQLNEDKYKWFKNGVREVGFV
jgi:hypothetical protein